MKINDRVGSRLWPSAVPHPVQFPIKKRKNSAQKRRGRKNKGGSVPLPRRYPGSIPVSSNSIPVPAPHSAAPAIPFQGNTELIPLEPHGTPQAALSGGDFADIAKSPSVGCRGHSWTPQTPRFSPPALIPLPRELSGCPGTVTLLKLCKCRIFSPAHLSVSNRKIRIFFLLVTWKTALCPFIFAP